MTSFTTRLADGLERAVANLVLVFIPIAVSLFEVTKILSIITYDGGHIGVRFGLPAGVVTVWQFVSVPNDGGVNVQPGLPIEAAPVAFATIPALIAVKAWLAAGYLGSIRNALDEGPYDFLSNARRHFLPLLVITLVPVLVLLPFALGVLTVGQGGPGTGAIFVLFGLALLAVFVLGYLFWATPYLVVLRDDGLLSAARASYGFAVDGGPYLAYSVGYAVFVLLVSPIATGVVVNVPAVGLAAGIIVGGFLGLVANVATMRFVADLDPESSVRASWDEGRGDRPTGRSASDNMDRGRGGHGRRDTPSAGDEHADSNGERDGTRRSH